MSAEDEPRGRASPDWKWRRFPVFFAFTAGLLVAALVNAPPQNAAAAVVQWGAIFAVGYGLAHLFVTNVTVAGRIRRRARGEDDWRDEIVYPDESPRS